MVGTEVGTVFLCNSKAKSIQEKLAQMYTAHLGNVRALQRNPMFPKNFLTVGDWTAKVRNCSKGFLEWCELLQ